MARVPYREYPLQYRETFYYKEADQSFAARPLDLLGADFVDRLGVFFSEHCLTSILI
jgi:hypothetical protein